VAFPGLAVSETKSAVAVAVSVQLRFMAVRGSRDSNDLIPLHEPFETARLGFNRRQVLDHLESLHGRIALIAADRDAALAQAAELSKVLDHLRQEADHLRQEADKATAQVHRILQKPMAEASARIQHILQLVEEEAAEAKAHTEAEISASKTRADQEIAELKVRANQEITELKTRADQEIAELKARANQDIAELMTRADQEIAELKARANDQITASRAQASHEATSLLDHARRQLDQLESESAARREAAEQAIAQREAKATERIRDSQLCSLAGVHVLLRVIDKNLEDRLAAIGRDESALHDLRAQMTSEATALHNLRAEVTAAALAAHQLFTEALEQAQNIPVEPAVDATDDPTEQPDFPIQRGAQGSKAYGLKKVHPEATSRFLPPPAAAK
jgi:F0F1-type ATP synthase membrane subunit b/b'